MKREELKKIMAHREPMLLLDETEIVDDGYAIGNYTIRGDEFFLQGHFPNYKVVPGVILCEMMAQNSVLLVKKTEENKSVVLTSIDKAKFRRQVRPNHKVILKSKLIKNKANFYFVDCEALVEDKVCANCVISFVLINNLHESENNI